MDPVTVFLIFAGFLVMVAVGLIVSDGRGKARKKEVTQLKRELRAADLVITAVVSEVNLQLQANASDLFPIKTIVDDYTTSSQRKELT